MDNADFPYATPQAFRQALSNLAANVASTSRYSNQELVHQFLYSRLLARIFHHDPVGWVLKGGIALLTRLPVARHSQDLDVARTGVSVEDALRDLEDATDLDLGDMIDFRVRGPRRDISRSHQGASVSVDAFVGGTLLGSFRVDVVTNANITAVPDVMDPLAPFDIPGVHSPQWRSYPVVDHLADKFAAMYETYAGQSSSRFRDLVDIGLILQSQTMTLSAARRAMREEFRFRRLRVPRQFETPDPQWRQGYSEISKSLPPETLSFDAACDVAGRFLSGIETPGIAEDAIWNCEKGTWMPNVQEW